jgi:hypothetical protein
LSGLRSLSSPRTFELGINSVVSHPTANWRTVRGLLDFAREIRADFVKFQPVFDDGYVSRNAPWLKLSASDVGNLIEISELIGKSPYYPKTNPSGFWLDAASLAQGGTLSPGSCALGPRHSISVQGKLKICYWVDSSTLGNSSVTLSGNEVDGARQKFEQDKLRCVVGFHCFCTQNLSHEWRRTSERTA